MFVRYQIQTQNPSLWILGFFKSYFFCQNHVCPLCFLRFFFFLSAWDNRGWFLPQMQTQIPNEDVSEQCRIEANTLLVQDCILLEEKSTSDLIPCGKNQPDHFNAQRAPGFLHRGISGRHPTRTTTTLHRLSCSCYLVVKSVQAWRISTTVSC